jgi:hypothetical protein
VVVGRAWYCAQSNLEHNAKTRFAPQPIRELNVVAITAQNPSPLSPGITSRVYIRSPVRVTKDEKVAERDDPWLLGYEAAENLGEPVDCPYASAVCASLWRKGFNTRVTEMIAAARSRGGVSANVGHLVGAMR